MANDLGIRILFLGLKSNYLSPILDLILILQQAAFVRDDELRQSWKIFTPVLHTIENENVRPIIYKQGKFRNLLRSRTM